MEDAIQLELDQLEKSKYLLKKHATEDFIKKIRAAAEFEKVDPNENQKKEVDQKAFTEFLKARNINPNKLTPKQLSDTIANYKIQMKVEETKKRDESILEFSKIKWKIPLPPENFVSIGNGPFPLSGSSKAPIKIVYVGNYHCPFCAEANKRLSELNEKYKDQIQVAYRFSMTEPDSSIVRAAAEATFCANDQGKFTDYHDQLVGIQKLYDVELLKTTAQSAGLDIGTFNTCLKDRKHKADLEKEVEENVKAVKDVVPAFVINGRLRSAALSLQELSLAIDQDLAD